MTQSHGVTGTESAGKRRCVEEMKAITFKDRVKIYVYAGDGGNGCSSFRKEKYIPKGGPDGGDGGNGGTIYLRANKDRDSLLDLYYRPHQRADRGQHGTGKQCTGRSGVDLYIEVPCGTQAFLQETDEFVGEVVEDGDTLLVAKGGKGGLGNMHFATPSHQAPRECTPGEEGEIKTLRLELKVVADVGLVGYPNAGKSTLLRALTEAKPKVGSYPFTTLNPIIGTLQYPDFKTLRVADIPGLIDGAHKGIGLGHDFLRHIERSGFLLFVIDMGGVDERHPADDLRSLRRELEMHQADLATRPYAVLANKMDEPMAEMYLEEFVEQTGEKPIPISAALGDGVDAVKQLLRERVIDARTAGPETTEDAAP